MADACGGSEERFFKSTPYREDVDHIVAGNGGRQRASIGFAPPMWRTGSFVIEGAPFRIPIFRGEGASAVMLEQHNGTAVWVEAARSCSSQGKLSTAPLVSAEAVKLDEMQAAPIPGIAVGFRVVIARPNRRLKKEPRPMVDLRRPRSFGKGFQIG